MTTTILTRPAADALGHIHDRTPVIVPAGLQGEWRDPELVPREVGKAVGNVRNNGPELIESVSNRT